jgi:16S rRNA A1518/A1519 N6-dimethyltransferase RsmA/KsgA/DIM1 with predicted DNA glycosylase/AP lyase activity
MSSLRQMLVNKFSMHPLQMRQATLNDSKLARRPAFICDPGLAKDIVHELGDLSGKSVLELNPGPGVTTRALLEGPVQRVDAVEPFVKFYPGIKVCHE